MQGRLSWLAAGATVALLALSGAASADTVLTLGGPINGNILGPQSASNPCIIAASTCQQPAGFGYNNFANTGGVTSYNMYSTDPTAKLADGVQGNPYTVSQLPTSFIVAIDVNTASPNTPGETLTSFQVLDTTTNTALYHFTGVAGSHNIGSPQNNGNGWADYTLSTVNLAGLPSTDHILF